jgi:poly-gamma-glutamate synthesis protein (capsule biosynthesis protein)
VADLAVAEVAALVVVVPAGAGERHERMKMKRYKYIILSLLLMVSEAGFAGDEAGGDRGTRKNSLRIVFAGDVMGHDSQINAAYIDSSDSYDYKDCFSYLKPYLQHADIAVANLEVTLAGPPYKGYPRFSSPDALLDGLMNAGFNVLVNANNHALDRGSEGLERTQDVVGRKGLILTGSFISSGHREQTYPLILEKNDIMLAMLNYTYGTNGLQADTPNIVNYIDTLMIQKDIQKVKLVEPDFVVASIHWGKEYQRQEDNLQHELAGFLFRQGVDVIIGSHPHVVQPVEYTQTDTGFHHLVVYSLGNFVSNQRDRYRDGGIIFGLELEKTDRTRISGFDYLPVWVHKPLQGEKQVFRLIPASLDEEEIERIGFTETELSGFRQFYEDTRDHLVNVPENRFYEAKE